MPKFVTEKKKVLKRVPVKKTVNEFYKVETVVDFVAREVTKEALQPVTKTINRPEYVPVRKEIVHYSQALIEDIKRGNVVLDPEIMARLRNAETGSVLTTY